ncbi:MAG: hypothetical protein Q8O31_02515 [Rhodocyclaceae bacterium]|nr:hypothetical protein [Rhodocyclaceae bacterium]
MAITLDDEPQKHPRNRASIPCLINWRVSLAQNAPVQFVLENA